MSYTRRVVVDSAAAPSSEIILEGLPNECPLCHHAVAPKPLAFVGSGPKEEFSVQEAFQCTNRRCAGIFVAVYRCSEGNTFAYSGSVPRTVKPPELSELVAELSPTFAEVYRQSFAAEAHGLTQLTGIGLRKSFEFLIKDYAVHVAGVPAETVGRRPLVQCIKDYLSDERLRECAERAAWLGNDEVHYTRQWTDKDVGDLKILIRIVVNLLENELLRRRYVEEMPRPARGEGS